MVEPFAWSSIVLIANPLRQPLCNGLVEGAAFATRATSREGPIQQRVGFLRPADSLCQRGRAAVGVHVAGVILLADQRRWGQRRRANGGSGGGVSNAATK
jgi:hypothetical protein